MTRINTNLIISGGTNSGLPSLTVVDNLGGNSLIVGDGGNLDLTDSIRIGYGSGDGDSDVFIGMSAGHCNITGNSNVFVGDQSGFYNSDGYCNVFIGKNSGYFNVNGVNNVAIGSNSLCGNTAGNGNIAIGTDALKNGCGNTNVAIGQQALAENRSGCGNFALGFNALSANLCGCYNIGIGTSNLGGLTGSSNIAIGYCSGQFADMGTGNVFIGQGTGVCNCVNVNTFIGYGSGNMNITGCSNTFIGYNSGNKNITGGSNTFIGFNAGLCNNDGQNNTYIGSDSGRIGTQSFSNTFIGMSSGFWNIGNYNTFIGEESGQNNCQGCYNTSIGQLSGAQLVDGHGNTSIGFNAGPTGGSSGLSSSIALGACAAPQFNGEFALGSSEYPVLIGSSSVAPNSDNLYVRINDDSYKIPLYDKNESLQVGSYKVYSALLNQNDPIELSGPTTSFIPGQIWVIDTYNEGDDFSNLELISGATANVTGAVLRSIGATGPSAWTASSVLSYDGSPYLVSIDVNGNFNPFINTIGGDIVWSYDGVGTYIATLNNAFVDNKTYITHGDSGIGDKNTNIVIYRNSNNAVWIDSYLSGAYTDNRMFKFPLEIRVYN